MFFFNASDKKRLMYIKPFSAKFMVFSFFPKIVGPFYLENYDVSIQMHRVGYKYVSQNPEFILMDQ